MALLLPTFCIVPSRLGADRDRYSAQTLDRSGATQELGCAGRSATIVKKTSGAGELPLGRDSKVDESWMGADFDALVEFKTAVLERRFAAHGATIGNAWQRTDGVPTIRPFSFIGAGATVIGRIQIGPVSAVGAEAVVTQDVPPFTLASGVPARVTPLAIDSLQRWFGLTRDELEPWIS